MLVLDQVKRSDPRLRWIASGVLLGLLILLSGLWYVQIVSRNKYQDSLRIQSFRNVRLPASRGKIFDRNGATLVENHPRFVVNLYLEDVRDKFTYEYTNRVKPTFVAKYNRRPKGAEIAQLTEIARYIAVSNIVWKVSSAVLPQPLILNPTAFKRHYQHDRAMPLTILSDLTPEQRALFTEKIVDEPALDLEVEPVRFYPHGALAAHTLGFVQRPRDDEEIEDEDEYLFRYRLPDYVGRTGIENGFDLDLRGKPGGKAILVNNLGYRQRDEIWLPPVPGKSVTLTLDLTLQKAVEKALVANDPETRGAALVLDVNSGDILAMASAPAFDLNMFVRGSDYSHEDWTRLNDETLTPQFNRALQGTYHPGSIFKIIVAMAAFEAGVITPHETVHNPGYYKVGRKMFRDDNAPTGGDYAFIEAFQYSANTYFMEAGLRAGVDRLLDMGNRFGLGERTGVVPTRFEYAGYFPDVGARVKKDGGRWMDGDTANLCIGQGEITVTPLQMALMTAAVANGGKLLKPRLVVGLEDQETGDSIETFPPAQVENSVNVSPGTIDLVRRAMFADVEEKKGTGHAAYIAGMGICGKTGTAQVRKAGGRMDRITWFVSFAPFDSPKYAVVVMTESGISGGGTCAPKAKEIYKAIQKLEQQPVPPKQVLTLAPR